MPKSVTFDRDQVMANVMKLFWEKGYNGTSMQDLVDTTGLNRSSFYNSFGDKFSLYEEALAFYEDQQLSFLEAALSKHQSPRLSIISFFKSITSDISKGDTHGCMLSKCTSEMSSQEPRLLPFLQKNKNRVLHIFTALIEKGQALGEISNGKKAATLALYLFSNLQGLRITSMLETDLEGVTDQILEAL